MAKSRYYTMYKGKIDDAGPQAKRPTLTPAGGIGATRRRDLLKTEGCQKIFPSLPRQPNLMSRNILN